MILSKLFLLANFHIIVILVILFLILINLEVNFLKLRLFGKINSFINIFLTFQEVNLVEKKEFITIAFVLNEKIYMIYMASFANFDSHIHFFSLVEIKPLKSANILIIVLD